MTGMNRREFSFGLLATGGAVALPAPAILSGAGALFTPFQYRSSVFMAQMEGRCSAALIAERFGLSPSCAKAIQASMIRNGVVAAPAALTPAPEVEKAANSLAEPRSVAADLRKSLDRNPAGCDAKVASPEEPVCRPQVDDAT